MKKSLVVLAVAVAAAVCRAEFGDELTYVCVGDECWYADDEETPLPHVFSCGATLHSTAGGYRLDLSNAIVIAPYDDGSEGAIMADGNLSIKVSGANYISGTIELWSPFAKFDLTIFGGGSIAFADMDDGYGLVAGTVSVCAGASLTFAGLYCAIEADEVLISGSSVGVVGAVSGIKADSKVTVLGGALAVNASYAGIDSAMGSVVVDGSVVNTYVSGEGACGIGAAGVYVSHSCLASAAPAGTCLSADELFFDNCLARMFGKERCIAAGAALFGEGDYYFGKGPGKPSDAYSIAGAVEAEYGEIEVDGGNLQICAPSCVGVDCAEFTLKSGRVEIVEKMDVAKFLKYDATLAAAYAGVASSSEVGVSSLAANFYSHISMDALANAGMLNLEGSAWAGFYVQDFKQEGGTVWCNHATRGTVATLLTVNGGSYRGTFVERSYPYDVSLQPSSSATAEPLKCVEHQFDGYGKYDKVSNGIEALVPRYYGTKSLYTDEAGKLYLWVPESFGGSGGAGHDGDNVFVSAGLSTDEPYVLPVGATPDLSDVVSAITNNGWKLEISGLPAGVKFDAKNNAITGAATTEGTFTVTFTATKGTEKEIATATFEVSYPVLSVEVAPHGDEAATNNVKVTGGGKYPAGKKVSLKATPGKGNVFAGWYGPVNTACCGMEPVYATGRLSQSATYSYVTTDADVALTAMFATESEDKASLKVSIPDDTTEDDGTYELDLSDTNLVSSLTVPKLTVKGLPTGLKYDAKTMKIAGKATKPGVYAVTVEATNTSVKKATDDSRGVFKLTVPNFKSDLFTAAGLLDKYFLAAGEAPDLSAVVALVKLGDWKLKVDGLPAGLKYDDKGNAIAGVATKEGAFTVTFTATKGKEKEVATATFDVAFPALTLGVAAYDDEGATNNVKVSGGGKYPAGKKVSLKATPGKGNVFAGWLDAEGRPLAGSVDYRTASYTYVATSGPVALTAMFATESEDKASLKVSIPDDTTEDDGTYELDLSDTNLVSSLTVPKLTVKGLPTGLKYDAKTMKIAGKATKPGVYAVTVEATNTSVKKATDDSRGKFTLTVPNKASAALPHLKSATNAYGTNFAGVVFDPAVVDCTPAEEGWTVKVAGLPAGLKYNANTGKITGVPTKAGSYTVTFAATKGKAKEEATITLNVVALPDWAVGTFDGEAVNVEVMDDDGMSRTVVGIVSLTVSATGKISGKMFREGETWTLSAESFDVYDEHGEYFIATGIGRCGKAAFTNLFFVSYGSDIVQGRGTVDCDETFFARQNLWKTKEWNVLSKSFAGKSLTLSGTADGLPTDGDTVTLTFASSGAVTASGKFVTGYDNKPVTYSATCSTVLVPKAAYPLNADHYPYPLTTILYFPPKPGKFKGYATELLVVWDGESLKLPPDDPVFAF